MTAAAWEALTLKGRDDDRSIVIEPSIAHEVGIRVGNQEPIYVDAIDFLSVASRAVLDYVYGPSPTRGAS